MKYLQFFEKLIYFHNFLKFFRGIVDASKNILAEGLNVLYSTVGHTGSNACRDEKVTEPLYGSVFVSEAGKRISNIV